MILKVYRDLGSGHIALVIKIFDLLLLQNDAYDGC